MFLCVARTEVDWKRFLPEAARALGRSVSASLDARGLPLCSAAFLVAASDFAHQGVDAFKALREDSLVRYHASFTLLVNIHRSSFFNLSSLGLHVTPASEGDFALVSGTIHQWVSAVVGGMRIDSLRQFSCLVHAWMEVENFGELFASWEKEHLQTGMYRLVSK